MTAPKPTLNFAPLGMRLTHAASYVGVSTGKFNGWVKDGRMPKPFKVDGIVLWDRNDIDIAFSELRDEDNQYDGVDPEFTKLLEEI
jgi:predicted DNA-binding transcriptional regulator AlpA